MSDSWMSNLDNNRTIGSLSIPGTHNSCALYGGDSYFSNDKKCQDASLDDQLRDGIRFFDIRLCTNNGNLLLFHNDVYQEGDFSNVCKTCQHFLAVHKTEFLIIRVKEESDFKDPSFSKIFINHAEQHDIFTIHGMHSKVGDVRGKVILLQDFNGSDIPFGEFYIKYIPTTQDRFKYVNFEEKWNAICENFDSAQSNPNIPHFNYISASTFDLSIFTFNRFLGPRVWADNMNTRLDEWLRNSSSRSHIGVIIMDFYKPETCVTIWKRNFR
ncbi:1-phosphatidylinositol phosphodiesterase [Acrasis kona]|uniref:1-phosphatidylinositol phosphodiesterase n=1 Tax=Acrasis kona TaxID=1008807 RepID=A0AAW2YI85_9EUKA